MDRRRAEGLPFDPPLVTADVTMTIGGATSTVSSPGRVSATPTACAASCGGDVERRARGHGGARLAAPDRAARHDRESAATRACVPPATRRRPSAERSADAAAGLDVSRPPSVPFTLDARAGQRPRRRSPSRAPAQRTAGALEIVAEAQVGGQGLRAATCRRSRTRTSRHIASTARPRRPRRCSTSRWRR